MLDLVKVKKKAQYKANSVPFYVVYKLLVFETSYCCAIVTEERQETCCPFSMSDI